MGAGLFGFMINPPIALYYVQGPEPHSGARAHRPVRRVRHAWAWGSCSSACAPCVPGLKWKDRPLAIAFWSINVGWR